MDVTILFRVFLFGAGAYAVVLLHYAGSPRDSRSTTFLEVALAAGLGAAITVVALSGVPALIAGVLGVASLGFLHSVVRRRATAWVPERQPESPRLLVYQGSFVPESAGQVPEIRDLVLGHLRARGVPSLGHVEALVLAPDGNVSLYRRPRTEMAPKGPLDVRLN